MKHLKAAVDKTTGWKTFTGAVITFLALAAPLALDLSKEMGATADQLAIVGTVIACVGILHKVWRKFYGV